MRFQLRPYQVEAVTGIRHALRDHNAVLFVLPTGGGKTVIFTFIAESANSRGNSVLILAHRRRIVRQISSALLEMGVRHGLILPGHTMTANPIQVGMVQTAARRLDRMLAPKLIIFDEAHHSVAGQWKKVIDAFPDAKRLGVTATPERLDGKGLGDAFDVIVQGPQMRDLIASGYLAPYRYFAPPPKADFSAIKTRAGDYAVDELASVLDKAVITGDAIAHYAKHLNGQPTIIFCVTIEHARHVAETFRGAGFRSEHISGEMEDAEQERLLNGLASGQIQVLTCCDLISEGVDVPAVAGIVLLRRSKSLTFFLQAIGRGLRLKAEGAPAIILDHVGCRDLHGLPDEIREWSLAGRAKRDASSTIRTCDTCFRTFRAGSPVDCDRASDCGLLSDRGSGEGRAPPEQVDGELVAVADPYEWAGGIDLRIARGDQWRLLLERADGDPIRLKQIAKARGFRSGWVQHVVREHAAGRSGGSDFQAREFKDAAE